MSAIDTIEKCLEDMRSGATDFTKDGECSNCGECCSSLLPVRRSELKAMHRYISQNHIKPHRTSPMLAVRFDMTCPFRNEKERKCDIYEARPLICRDYRCDKTHKGIVPNPEFDRGEFIVVNMREEFCS